MSDFWAPAAEEKRGTSIKGEVANEGREGEKRVQSRTSLVPIKSLCNDEDPFTLQLFVENNT